MSTLTGRLWAYHMRWVRNYQQHWVHKYRWHLACLRALRTGRRVWEL